MAHKNLKSARLTGSGIAGLRNNAQAFAA